VTVAVEVDPPLREAGDRLRLVMTKGPIVSADVYDTEPCHAVMVAVKHPEIVFV
jgi:hypothetical protein